MAELSSESRSCVCHARSINPRDLRIDFVLAQEPLEVSRPDGRVELQHAVTAYRCLARSGAFAWLELRPATGAHS